MRTIYFLVPVLFMSVLLQFHAVHAQSVLFFEDFEKGMPNDFTLIDADRRVVQDQVDLINKAWIALPNDLFIDANSGEDPFDTLAVSTSFYEPPGKADDWMILPPISIPDTGEYIMEWLARALDADFPDGYEVRVSTQGRTIPEFTQTIFSTPAEVTEWTLRNISLKAFSGKTINIAFRNNSDDKYILLINDIAIVNIKVANRFDAALIASNTPDEYASTPLGQAAPFRFEAIVENQGADTLTNVGMVVGVIDQIAGAQDLVYTDPLVGPIALLAPGDIDLLSTGNSYTPVDTGFHAVAFSVFATEEETDENDNDTFELINITDTVMARDNLSLFLNGYADNTLDIQGIGFGKDANSEMAVLYEMRREGTVSSATTLMFPDRSFIGDSVYFSLYTIPDTIPLEVGRSPYYVLSGLDTPFTFITLPFFPLNSNPNTAGVKLSPGSFLISVHELTDLDQPLPLATTSDIYTEFTNYIRTDSILDGEWIPIEVFNQAFSWVIEANIQTPVVSSGKRNIDPDLFTVYPNPVSDRIFVRIKKGQPGETRFNLTDPMGRLISEIKIGSIGNDSFELDVMHLNPGLYLLEISNDQGTAFIRVVKR